MGLAPSLKRARPRIPGYFRRTVVGSVKQHSESPAESTTHLCVKTRPPNGDHGMNSRLSFALVAMVAVTLLTVPATAQEQFTFTDFSSTTGLTLNGTPQKPTTGSVTINNGQASPPMGTVLQLTPAMGGRRNPDSKRVYHEFSVPVHQPFKTSGRRHCICDSKCRHGRPGGNGWGHRLQLPLLSE
jgi:hypothetical protein